MNKIHLVPGWVISQYDGVRHYIGYGQLLDLYRLKAGDCVFCSGIKTMCRGHKHLFPKADGNYVVGEIR